MSALAFLLDFFGEGICHSSIQEDVRVNLKISKNITVSAMGEIFCNIASLMYKNEIVCKCIVDFFFICVFVFTFPFLAFNSTSKEEEKPKMEKRNQKACDHE